jgi:hypothetical protein
MSTTYFTASPSAAQPRLDTARRYLVPGLSAGAVFLSIELLAGAFTTDLWRFPAAIAETIGVNSPLAPALGVVIHFAGSMLLGALFVVCAERFQLRGRRLLAAGVLFMLAESPISIWLVLHTLFPTTLPILFDAVPFWASLLGRIMFGVVLAEVYARVHRY